MIKSPIEDPNLEMEVLKNKLEILTKEVNKLKPYKTFFTEKVRHKEKFSLEIYELVIFETSLCTWTHSFRGCRLRIALMLLALTGLKITQLLSLKVDQVTPLFETSYYQDFFTPEGINVIQNRKDDFSILTHFKESDEYIFTAENSKKHLKREVLVRIINELLKNVCQKYNKKLTLTSNKFKWGFLDKLWIDIKDIEFVKRKLF